MSGPTKPKSRRPSAPRALIVGGSTGIGWAIATALADLDYAVTVTYHTHKPPTRSGSETSSHYLDLGDSASIERLVDHLENGDGLPQVLVQSAADLSDASMLRLDRPALERSINTNLIGPIDLLRRCAAEMAAKRWGRVVLIGSATGIYGNAGQSAYCSSKSAYWGLARTIAKELGARGVTSNVIEPGLIDTALVRKMGDAWWKDAIGRTPLGRAGTPEEIARVVAFLASEDAKHITGNIIRVDGGLSAWDNP